MHFVKKVLLFVLLAVLACVWSGCENASQSGAVGEKPEQPAAPVALSFYAVANSISITDDDFQKDIVQPIQKKYPNFQLSYVKKGPGFTLAELATAGNIPDIIMGTFGDMANLNNLNIPYDLTELIKSNRFDTKRLDPMVVDAVKQYSSEGKTLFIPYAVNTAALYYNKDIFDKFGVAYPKDSMTWDDTLALAKKLTRGDGGTQYQGYEMDVGFMLNNNQLSVGYIAKGTDKLNTEGLKRWFTVMRPFYELPSLTFKAIADVGNKDAFLKDKRVAMYAAGNIFNLLEEDKSMNWDMVSLPTFSDAPGVGLEPNTPYYLISSTSKNKQQAFQAISVLLTDELQTAQTRGGLLTVLNNDSIKKQVMQDTPFKNKHTEALYKNKFAAPRYVSEYDQFTGTVNLFRDMIVNNKDINTVFREGEEATQKKVDAYKAGQGK